MGLALKKTEIKYTYGDYYYWPDSERWELIEGIAYSMSPAPLRSHQKISIELCRQISNYLKDKTCEVYDAPFDVRLPEADEADKDIQTVVQPDIVVVCDESKLDERGCKGAPDLIIEITSPSTFKRDLEDKYIIYEKHGVKEYWIVYPSEKTVTVFKLDRDGRYDRPKIYISEDKIKVGVLNGLSVDLNFVFEKEDKKTGVKPPPDRK